MSLSYRIAPVGYHCISPERQHEVAPPALRDVSLIGLTRFPVRVFHFDAGKHAERMADMLWQYEHWAYADKVRAGVLPVHLFRVVRQSEPYRTASCIYQHTDVVAEQSPPALTGEQSDGRLYGRLSHNSAYPYSRPV